MLLGQKGVTNVSRCYRDHAAVQCKRGLIDPVFSLGMSVNNLKI